MKLIVILGPTAIGKTKIAIELAKTLGGEIISADSRQVYKELEIGTAKPSKVELEAIPHHLLVSVEEDSPILIGGKSFQPWYTPGHAKHHLAWQLDDMLFTGDVAGVKIEKGPVMPPCPPPDIDIFFRAA